MPASRMTVLSLRVRAGRDRACPSWAHRAPGPGPLPHGRVLRRADGDVVTAAWPGPEAPPPLPVLAAALMSKPARREASPVRMIMPVIIPVLAGDLELVPGPAGGHAALHHQRYDRGRDLLDRHTGLPPPLLGPAKT
jgi:hypothetical protein